MSVRQRLRVLPPNGSPAVRRYFFDVRDGVHMTDEDSTKLPASKRRGRPAKLAKCSPTMPKTFVTTVQ